MKTPDKSVAGKLELAGVLLNRGETHDQVQQVQEYLEGLRVYPRPGKGRGSFPGFPPASLDFSVRGIHVKIDTTGTATLNPVGNLLSEHRPQVPSTFLRARFRQWVDSGLVSLGAPLARHNDSAFEYRIKLFSSKFPRYVTPT